MKVTYDPRKRAVEDRRFDYGEARFSTYGYLRGRLVNVVWTPRAGSRRIISMRKCNAKEVSVFKTAMD